MRFNIDGDDLDAEFAETFGLTQANVSRFLEFVDDWNDGDKLRFIIAVGECGYVFNPDIVHPNDFDVEFYTDVTMWDLAEQFVNEGLFGEVPKHLEGSSSPK